MRPYGLGGLILLASLPFAPAQDNSSSSKPQPGKEQVQPAENTPQGQSKIDATKEADIRRLMDLTGVGNLVIQAMRSMEGNIRPLLIQSLPPGEYRGKLIDLYFDKFRSKASIKEFVDIGVPVYDKYYSHDEIRGLIQFYETPLGQKTIAILPNLMTDLQVAGKNWGGELGRQSMAEVLSEHPELARALEDAKRPPLPK